MTDEPATDTASDPDETPATPVPVAHGPWTGRTVTTAALLAVLALLVGGVGGAWLTGQAPGDDSAEAGFARDMSTHHAQAVSMGTLVYRTTDDAHVRSLAIDIVLTQQAQIGMMQAWLDDWGLSATGQDPPMAWMADDDSGHGHGDPAGDADAGAGLMPGMATPAQLDQLRRLRGTRQDVLFCQLMIVHHQAGIAMTEAVLARTNDRQVRELAISMKNGQASEIDALQNLLRRLGGTVPR